MEARLKDWGRRVWDSTSVSDAVAGVPSGFVAGAGEKRELKEEAKESLVVAPPLPGGCICCCFCSSYHFPKDMHDGTLSYFETWERSRHG